MNWPEITKGTLIEEVKRIHQAIWDYVIEHGKKPITPYQSNCVACEYADLFRDPTMCDACPVVWPKNKAGGRHCAFSDGIYDKWKDADGDKKTELACQIRDLPWKFETSLEDDDV